MYSLPCKYLNNIYVIITGGTSTHCFIYILMYRICMYVKYQEPILSLMCVHVHVHYDIVTSLCHTYTCTYIQNSCMYMLSQIVHLQHKYINRHTQTYTGHIIHACKCTLIIIIISSYTIH